MNKRTKDKIKDIKEYLKELESISLKPLKYTSKIRRKKLLVKDMLKE
jgi:hypothetical protein